MTVLTRMLTISNTEILCFILGWQGGTVHQVAEALGVASELILNADYMLMQHLMRKAQIARSETVLPHEVEQALQTLTADNWHTEERVIRGHIHVLAELLKAYRAPLKTTPMTDDALNESMSFAISETCHREKVSGLDKSHGWSLRWQLAKQGLTLRRETMTEADLEAEAFSITRIGPHTDPHHLKQAVIELVKKFRGM